MKRAGPRVLIIGGNRSTVGSIKAMRAAGFEVIVADKLPRQSALAEANVGFEISPGDVPGLGDAIRSLGGVDGIIGINELAMLSAAELQEQFGYIGLPVDVIQRTTSKLAQRRCWNADRDLAVDYRIAEDVAQLPAASEAIGGYPIVMKPDVSQGGSRGVTLVRDGTELERAFEFAREHALPGSHVLLEKALEGPQFSAELLVMDGRTWVLAIGRKIKSEAPYRVDLAIAYPGTIEVDELNAIRHLCEKATTLLGISRGPAHFEFCLTEQGPRPIEIAARCGGSITPDLAAHVSGYHPMVEAARLACGIEPDLTVAPSLCGAILMFIAFPPCVASKLHLEEVLQQYPSVIDFDSWLPPDGVVRPIQWTSQRTGYVGIVADKGTVALAIAQEIAEQIYVETPEGNRLRPLTFASRHEIAT